MDCIRSRQESIESEIFEEETEEHALEEEQEPFPEVIIEEEKVEILEESVKEEEESILFPSPSLRKALPDKVRKIECQNRLHVLPDEFRTDIDTTAIPKINQTPHQKYIDILAEMVGCTHYRSSLAEFWFLDTLANLLRRAQEDDLNRPTQALLILWFCEWMKEVQYFDAADRQRMLKRFRENMLAAARFVATDSRIPSPLEVGVYYKYQEQMSLNETNNASVKPTAGVEPSVTFAGTAFECSMRDLTKIIHYIFDLFSTDFQYELVRSVFTFPPDYILIDSPYQIQVPKRLYAPSKAKPKKEKSPKKDKKDAVKKKNEPETEEYLALMELKAREEREVELQMEKDQEDYNLRSHILPLSFAGTQELFEKYWPPPPPPPETESDLEPEKKGKKKK